MRAAIACAADMVEPLRRALQHDGDINVTTRITAAPPGRTTLPADILVVDVASLGESGLELVRVIMQLAPLPVLVLCPGDGDHDTPSASQALRDGAVDAIAQSSGLDADGRLLRERAHLVRGVGVVRRGDTRPPTPALPATGRGVVAVAASTGGPPALATLLSQLAGLSMPLLLIQHLNLEFMADFVGWLGGLSALPVDEATHGQSIHAGRVYVAPANRHLRLQASGHLELSDRPDGVHRPSADELFLSVAANAGRESVGVVLTGMGRDGAAGLLAMRRAGAITIVQDEATSAVFGMPQAALEVGAADRADPLDTIAATILAAVRRG
jgi:two-component system chemotaxis response regulator CheB